MRFIYTLTFSFLIMSTSIYSQEPKQDSIYNKVDVMPEYSDGGINGFKEFFYKKYRTPRVKENINGTINVEFVIEIDGSISNVKCSNDLGYGICDEAIRVVKKSRKWIPGIHNGKPVRVQYIFPYKIVVKNKYLAK